MSTAASASTPVFNGAMAVRVHLMAVMPSLPTVLCEIVRQYLGRFEHMLLERALYNLITTLIAPPSLVFPSPTVVKVNKLSRMAIGDKYFAGMVTNGQIETGLVVIPLHAPKAISWHLPVFREPSSLSMQTRGSLLAVPFIGDDRRTYLNFYSCEGHSLGILVPNIKRFSLIDDKTVAVLLHKGDILIYNPQTQNFLRKVDLGTRTGVPYFLRDRVIVPVNEETDDVYNITTDTWSVHASIGRQRFVASDGEYTVGYCARKLSFYHGDEQSHISFIQPNLDPVAVDGNDPKNTALHMVAFHGDDRNKMLDLSMHHTLEATNSVGQNFLHFAAALNRYETVKFFERSGALRNARDAQGNTPYMLAARNGHQRVVRLLIKRDERYYHPPISFGSHLIERCGVGCGLRFTNILSTPATPPTITSFEQAFPYSEERSLRLFAAGDYLVTYVTGEVRIYSSASAAEGSYFSAL